MKCIFCKKTLDKNDFNIYKQHQHWCEFILNKKGKPREITYYFDTYYGFYTIISLKKQAYPAKEFCYYTYLDYKPQIQLFNKDKLLTRINIDLSDYVFAGTLEEFCTELLLFK